jgi:hypothetical protein
MHLTPTLSKGEGAIPPLKGAGGCSRGIKGGLGLREGTSPAGDDRCITVCATYGGKAKTLDCFGTSCLAMTDYENNLGNLENLMKISVQTKYSKKNYIFAFG